MLFSLLISVSWAATPMDLANGWYLAESGRLEAAAMVAVKALSESENDLEAHRLYADTVVRGLKEGAALDQTYRAWIARDPTNPVPQVAQAGLLLARNARPGLWCGEVEKLLEKDPQDTGVRTYAARYRYEARLLCGGDVAAAEKQILELAEVTPTALGPGLRIRMRSGKVDEDLAADLRTFYVAEPWNLTEPGNLWAESMKGPAIKQARADALNAARLALQSDSPAVAQAALDLYTLASNDPGKLEAAKRRAALDPEWRVWETLGPGDVPSTTGNMSLLERQLDAARRRASVEVARKKLEELEPRIPPKGALRATWLKEMAFVLQREGKTEESFAMFKAAWQADPTNASAANAFAYSAALKGQDLDLALVVIDSVLRNLAPYDPWSDWKGEGYETWSDRTADQVAARMDTRAWILYQLGRKEEAAAALQHALLLTTTPDPILHHHLGIVLHSLGKDDAALQQLGRGLSMGPSDEPELDVRARALATELFASRRWAPGGLDTWLTTRSSDYCPSEKCAERLTGFHFTANGRDQALKDFTGVTVVVLWSARSQNFEKTLSYWKDLEQKYRTRKVNFLGLCVDKDPATVDTYWEGYRFPPFLLGHVPGDVVRDLAVPGVPAVFVMDGSGRVIGTLFQHIQPADHKVEQWIDEALAAAPAETPKP